MAGRNIQPLRFNPRSVVDALDGGSVAEGGMRNATNLIFDPENPFTFQCRPAAIKTFDFTGIAGAGAVSVSFVVGNICYGMIKSTAVATYDQPFAYNLVTNALISVSGTQDATTLPLTPATTGAWTPPTMDLVGVKLYVTHPGFIGGAAAFFGWFDTTNPAAPVWHAGNTGTNALPSVPTAVAQFNNRAWFAVGNVLAFTDALTTNISDATHFLTMEHITTITALATQSVTTGVQGQLQGLAVFGATAITLITGDDAFGNLATNTIDETVGTRAPRSVAPTPKGIMFKADDGIRTISPAGTLSDPNMDLKDPFIYSAVPSRDSAAYNNNIYRITVQNGHTTGNQYQEYWFDLRMNGWTGPHTFVQDMAVPYLGTFIIFKSFLAPSLFTSDVVQSSASTFTENGTQLSFIYRTAPLSDMGGMYENTAILSVIDMLVPQQAQTYICTAIDSNNGTLSQASISFNGTGGLWNGQAFGPGIWIPLEYGLERYNIQWNQPLVFSRLVFQITGVCVATLKIGKLMIGYQPAKYPSMTVQQVPLPYVTPALVPSGNPFFIDLFFPGTPPLVATANPVYTFPQAVKILCPSITPGAGTFTGSTAVAGTPEVAGHSPYFILASENGLGIPTNTNVFIIIEWTATPNPYASFLIASGGGNNTWISSKVSGGYITFNAGDKLYLTDPPNGGNLTTLANVALHIVGVAV